MYDTLEEALNANEGLQTQGSEGPKKVKVRTHTFSNGETYTYTTAKGIVFEDDVLLMTTKKLRRAFKDYEQWMEGKEKKADTLTTQAFAGIRASAADCDYYRNFGSYLNCYDDPNRRWPNSTIWIDTDSLDNFNSNQQQQIIDDFADVAARSDLKVRYRTPGIRVKLTNIDGAGCYAIIGYYSNSAMNLTDKCFGRQPKHELLHVAGYYHEQRRPDRNDYIKVFEDNLTSEGVRAFAITRNVGQFFNNYDYGSIMQYTLESVNTNPKYVEDTSIGAFKVIGGYSGIVGGQDLSPNDILMINARY